MVFSEMFRTNKELAESFSPTSLTMRATHMRTEEFIFLRYMDMFKVGDEKFELGPGRFIRTSSLGAPEQQRLCTIRYGHGTDDSARN